MREEPTSADGRDVPPCRGMLLIIVHRGSMKLMCKDKYTQGVNVYKM